MNSVLPDKVEEKSYMLDCVQTSQHACAFVWFSRLDLELIAKLEKELDVRHAEKHLERCSTIDVRFWTKAKFYVYTDEIYTMNISDMLDGKPLALRGLEEVPVSRTQLHISSPTVWFTAMWGHIQLRTSKIRPTLDV